MLIGKFTQEGDGYKGRIYGPHWRGVFVVFSPVPAKQGNGPDFVVIGEIEGDGDDYEVGAAWKKTSKAGKAYLSVKLDSPFLPEPVNCALIKQPDGSYGLVWNRDRKADEEQAAA